MIEVTKTAELVPENDLQELWKLAGRVDALRAWLTSESERDIGHLVYARSAGDSWKMKKADAANIDQFRRTT